MADRVLPTLLVLAVVREVLHDKLIDTVQGEALLRALTDRHHYQRVVTVRGLLVLFLVTLSLGDVRRYVLFVFVGAAV